MKVLTTTVLFLLLHISQSCFFQPATAVPLHTDGRWIVDENGRRVKLACVSWPSHMETLTAEGLGKLPLDDISKSISSMGFNCVRFTWPIFMFTNDTLANLTVRNSLLGVGLAESAAALRVNNPSLADVSVVQAFQAVVANLGSNGIMVILDNHVSKPGWCCGNTDGNGFFGDKYFDPDLWIQGLTRVATMFKGSSNVVGMSLRNELRGPRQNANDWYKYMTKGAEAVHSANPNVLVILSGLSFDTDLNFLSQKQLNLSFTGKVVFEFHWYGFTDGSAWVDGNPNDVCGRVVNNVMWRAGYLLNRGFPLFLSEFGLDLRGTNVNDNRYLSCVMAFMAEMDLDWSYWVLVGSYYTREGNIGTDETYGLLSYNWCRPRNSGFLQRIHTLQSPFRGPKISELPPYKVLFHPATGLCVSMADSGSLRLSPCDQPYSWSYTDQRTIIPLNTNLCLQAKGIGEAANLEVSCDAPTAKWDLISDSKMHISTNLTGIGETVCLDVDSNQAVITTRCKCLSKDKSCEPDSQWFKFVESTRKLGDSEMLLSLGVELLEKSFNAHQDM